MHVISRKKLTAFWTKHPDAVPGLQAWYRIVKKTTFLSFVDLRTTFPSADLVGGLTVFNIGGNKYRLVTAIHYNRRKTFVRAIMAHAEYDRGEWRKA